MRKLYSLIFGAVALGAAFQSQAQIVILTNNNSQAIIDTGSSAGMSAWNVQGGGMPVGQNQLNQQWFFFRTGAVGPAATINTLSAPSNSTFLGTRGLTTIYTGSQFSIQIDYLLAGGASVPAGGNNVSDITETITITKALNAGPVDLRFFQYSDFNLGGGGSDTVSLTQDGGLYYKAKQSNPLTDISETVTTPGANHGQVGTGSGILSSFASAGFTTLSDVAGPLGPGNVAWAFEWDIVLDDNNPVFIISKDKRLNVVFPVPEPAPLALISAGAIFFALYRRRRTV